MGLDVYVGTLTRYYAGEWQTVVQQATRDAGFPVTIIRHNVPSDAVTDPAVIEPAVIAWRDALNVGLRPHLTAPLTWNEGMTPSYFTDKPAWESYAALLIWAAHEEHRGLPLPSVAPEDWSADVAVCRSQAEGFRSRYGQLLHGAELWLPGDFSFTFSAGDLGGDAVTIGCVHALVSQLRDLNDRTWKANAAEVSEYLRLGAERGAPLETSARFGFAVFMKLAESAAEHHLPLKLDY